MRNAIIIGVGPDRGLGAQLCKRFATEGLKVLAAGRTQSALEAVVAGIKAAGGEAEAVVADATREADIVSLFDRAGDGLELAIYNAGNNTPGRIADMEASYFENAWRTGCFGGFLFGREAVRRMLKSGGGTLLFTGASASLRGRSNFGAFNSAKAACGRWRRQWPRNMARTVSMSATSLSMAASAAKSSAAGSTISRAASIRAS
jgi:NAD(P)-dependent dehydrogenase (short-subunit alcohol dehydrogenase family)